MVSVREQTMHTFRNVRPIDRASGGQQQPDTGTLNMTNMDEYDEYDQSRTNRSIGQLRRTAGRLCEQLADGTRR